MQPLGCLASPLPSLHRDKNRIKNECYMYNFRLLLNGASLIAIHEGRYYKRSDGLALGPGAFVKGLEYSSNVKAEVVGKPTIEFFKAALGEVDAAQAVMIGDVNNFLLL